MMGLPKLASISPRRHNSSVRLALWRGAFDDARKLKGSWPLRTCRCGCKESTGPFRRSNLLRRWRIDVAVRNPLQVAVALIAVSRRGRIETGVRKLPGAR